MYESTGNENNLYTGEARQDNSIDIASLVTKAKTKPMNIDSQEEAAPAEAPKKRLSPLDQMKAEAENSRGMQITKEEYEKGLEKKELKDFSMNETRVDAIEERINDLDDTIQKRAAVIVTTNPVDAHEYTEMMMEIDSVVFDENGVPSIDYRNEDDEPIPTKYIRLRTPEDPEFKEGKDALFVDNLPEEYKKDSTETEESSQTSTEKETEPVVSEEDLKRRSIVSVLIDKTGFGADFAFTPEEKEKIVESQEIRLTEVEVLDLASIQAKTTNKSFQETIKEYELSNSKTTICFPASGFKAQMKGLTYGEMADITLSMDNVTVDQYYKRMSIIYNKMTNISTGPFASFEDFLKKFAYVDIPVALYGLYVATQPEIQQIQLICGNPSCKHHFNWSFSTRSLLRLNDCSMGFLEKMREIATAPAADYDRLRDTSAVANAKYFKLPYSGFVIEMGIISSYEFIYNFIPVLNEETFTTAFGTDPNGIYMNNALLLTTVRSVRVPNPDGTYTLCTGYKDILDAIYNITPEEIKILASVSAKLTSEYQSSFALEEVQCPHCKNVTKTIDVSMDDLVFQTYQRLMNTEINVENIQGL